MVLRILYIFPSEELSLKSPRSGSHCSAVMYFQIPEELRRVMSEKEPHSVAILWVTLGSIICGIMAACGLYPHGRMSPNSAFPVNLLLALYLSYI